MCINLSGHTLADAGFLEFVVDCLDRTGVAPERVCFEVTENSVITNIDHARRFIGVLHGMGCRFALDDFGRGLSSFANLKHLSLDYLKIDGSFVRDILKDERAESMVRAIAQLARAMDITTVAEYVETEEIRTRIRALGVDYGQGFAIARPVPVAEVLEVLPVLAAATAGNDARR